MWGLLRKDLGEFVTTLKDDAAGTIKSALGEREQELNDSSYDEESDGVEIDGRRRQRLQQHHGHQRATAALRAMRADINTYTEDVPDEEREQFLAFLRRFDLGARTKDIATLLKEDPVVTKIHTQLVPEYLTYDDFWTRYFFRSEGVEKGKAAGGASFPQADEVENEEDFGWGEDDLEEDQKSNDGLGDVDGDSLLPPVRPSATMVPAGERQSPPSSEDGGHALGPSGGALGKMSSESAAASPADGSPMAPPSEVAAAAVAVVAAASEGKSLASEAALAEISRLTAALRECEAERDFLAGARANGGAHDGSSAEGIDDRTSELTRQRDAATAEAEELRANMRRLEAEHAQALAAAAADLRAATTAAKALEEDRDRQRAKAEESLALVAAAEEQVRVHAASRAAAEQRIASETAAVRAGADGSASGTHTMQASGDEEEGETGEEKGGDLAAAEAAAAAVAAAEATAEEAASELSRVKQAFREERAEHESMLRASRQAANEAVEAALASADADREEACAELAASMKEKTQQKDEELEALRAQLAKSSAAMEEVSTLKADLEDLHQAAEQERELKERAVNEARQEADAIKQLREEIRVLRAVAQAGGASAGAARRSKNARSDVGGGGEDTDGWGEDEDDSYAASTNSSGVVVDRLSSSTSPARSQGATATTGHGRFSQGDDEDGGASARASASAGASVNASGNVARDPVPNLSPSGGREQNRIVGGGDADAEVDDGWEGWD